MVVLLAWRQNYQVPRPLPVRRRSDQASTRESMRKAGQDTEATRARPRPRQTTAQVGNHHELSDFLSPVRGISCRAQNRSPSSANIQRDMPCLDCGSQADALTLTRSVTPTTRMMASGTDASCSCFRYQLLPRYIGAMLGRRWETPNHQSIPIGKEPNFGDLGPHYRRHCCRRRSHDPQCPASQAGGARPERVRCRRWARGGGVGVTRSGRIDHT
jgi:hypothetical protein